MKAFSSRTRLAVIVTALGLGLVAPVGVAHAETCDPTEVQLDNPWDYVDLDPITMSPDGAACTVDPDRFAPAPLGYDPADPEGNTGDAEVPTPEQAIDAAPYIADSPDAEVVKVAALAQIAAMMAMQDAGLLADQAAAAGGVDGGLDLAGTGDALAGTTSDLLAPAWDPKPKPKNPPRALKIENAMDTLHMQETGYTCAPASVRSIIHAMTGTDLSESSLAGEMKTSSSNGTYWPEVKKALNNHQDYDNFIGKPENGDLTQEVLMRRVVLDVSWGGGYKPHAAVLNVNQKHLKYWGRTKNGKHYLISHGYNQDAKKLLLGDVARSKFGQWTVPLSEAHDAVVGNKGLVIW